MGKGAKRKETAGCRLLESGADTIAEGDRRTGRRCLHSPGRDGYGLILISKLIFVDGLFMIMNFVSPPSVPRNMETHDLRG
jgi:hypothetical protein